MKTLGKYATIYNSKRWRVLRHDHLSKEPLCRYCHAAGDIVAADTVDHIKPHKGDLDLAFDPGNLQSLCKTCHDIHADAKDREKVMAGCDADGYPIDPSHVWSD